MKKNNSHNCPACDGVGEVKIIKNIAQIGPYHLGKEIIEKCRFCETYKKVEHRVYDEFRGKPN